MKKTLLLFLLFISVTSQAQNVNIPDPYFKYYMVSEFDSSDDGEIQLSEAEAVTDMYVSDQSIVSMEGIQSFVNLTNLNLNLCESLTSVNISGLSNLQTVSINYSYVLNSVNVTGCSALKVLEIVDSNLSSLNVGGLSNLEILNCYQSSEVNGLLAALNISGCIGLKNINLENNHLTSLDLSDAGLLEELNIRNNYFSGPLSLTNSSFLTNLKCEGNQITDLNVSGLTNLYIIYANGDYFPGTLTSINASGCSALFAILANSNNLTSLNISGCIALNQMHIDDNLLSTLDISDCPVMDVVELAMNPIQSIFAKNGANEVLYFGPTTQLKYICADDSQIPAILSSLNPNQLASIAVNSYCSFNPGGNFNTISGKIKYDANSNGCDMADNAQPWFKVQFSDGITTGVSFTNLVADYNFFVQTGTFTVIPIIENPSFFAINPANATLNFASNNNTVSTQNFCVTPVGVHSDVEVVIVPVIPARPGFDADYEIIYKNKGNQTLSGEIVFSYDEDLLDFVSASVTPDTQSAGNLAWNYSALQPFESRSFRITLNVNSPMETPTVNIGDILPFEATITPSAGDENATDNSFGLHQTVVGSFDPNDKICLEGETVSPTEIGKYLHYVINFENTGTSAAENIVVKDMIDATKFDIATLEVASSSHPAFSRVINNKAEFIFQNINLAAGEHGNVVFKIKTKSTLVTGNSVTNKADIYFDYNFPVTTNEATTTFQTLGTGDFIIDNSVTIAPNPAKDVMKIKAAGTIKSIQLFDAQGRILVAEIVENNHLDFNITAFSNGIYFMKIYTETGTKIERIIKK